MMHAKILLGVAAAVSLLCSPAYAAKVTLKDADLSQVAGRDNTYVFGGAATSQITNSGGAKANITFGWFQWSDDHSADKSLGKGSNDQSGTASAVQQNVSATINNLAWGSIGQSVVTNAGKVTLSGPEVNMAYGVLAVGGF